MTIVVNYDKRKNTELFNNLDNQGFTNAQNYIPLYRNFFVLNDNNYSSVNLNHTYFIDKIQKSISDNIHICLIKSKIQNKPRPEKVFFKFAPLIDPVKYMIGKYTIDEKLTTLPNLQSTAENSNSKIIDPNNSSYVDGFFSYLTNQLLSFKQFIHGVRYYGSFLTIKKDYKLNVYDDLEYLVKSDFFHKNKDSLFKIDNYSDLFEDDSSRPDLPTIKIHNDEIVDKDIQLDKLEETIFDEVFVENIEDSNDNLDLTDMNLTSQNLQTHNEFLSSVESENNNNEVSPPPSSYTNISCKNTDSSEEENSELSYTDDDDEDQDESESSESSSYESSDSEEEVINAYFPNFPIQLICMEACSDTLDQLILDDKMTQKLWFSCLMQVIMTLITYQKVFSFTHNDLHTNNIMYISTKKKFLYYCFRGNYYKVPTLGKIFKIIDFGRAIYKYDGKLMCSDSFSPNGDAATQYNIEPYYNSKKPRLEPNYSFDLCRLACSIFDYLIEDIKDLNDIVKTNPVARIIVEWCIDDNGINVLYKNNGTDRYPDFKLYKMIARCVHKHTPQAQLDRNEFKDYIVQKDEIPNSEHIMNIDEM